MKFFGHPNRDSKDAVPENSGQAEMRREGGGKEKTKTVSPFFGETVELRVAKKNYSPSMNRVNSS